MKATEFRIGNLVNYDGNVIRLELEHFADFYHYPAENRKYDYIPLTEERLLKFGFESLLSGAGYVQNCTEIGYNHNGFYIIASGLKIKYVHQLQNLYFALTGEELTTKTD